MSGWTEPPPRPQLVEDEVHVWRVVIDDAPLPALEPHLSVDERARVDRFVVEKPKRELVAGRGVLRELLALYLGREPGDFGFAYGKDGKPKLDEQQPSLSFNVSHSHGVVLLAFSPRGELGVDVERVREDMEHLKVSERFFSSAERRSLAELPAQAQARGFFRCWTRKEALLKARGTGLRTPLRDFDVTLTPDEPAAILATRFDPPDAESWTLEHLDLGECYMGAIALSFKPGSIRTWNWSQGQD